MIKSIQLQQPLVLESGVVLPVAKISYTLQGRAKGDGSNVVWVCHALTANADPSEWWSGLVGESRFFDPANYCIVCINNLASCYGTLGPTSINPETRKDYGLEFPEVSIRDMALLHQLTADQLGFTKIGILVGGSMGGQQALEWAISEPQRFESLILVATNAKHSPWGIAFNASQRLAIEADASFYSNDADAGKKGLIAARSLALLSYRTYASYTKTQEGKNVNGHFEAENYQRYQGVKLANRFDARSYWHLSKAMDSHDCGRNRGGTDRALRKVQARTLVIGIQSDLLFPIEEQEYLEQHIPDSQFARIESVYGHDGFLIETEQITQELEGFLQQKIGSV